MFNLIEKIILKYQISKKYANHRRNLAIAARCIQEGKILGLTDEEIQDMIAEMTGRPIINDEERRKLINEKLHELIKLMR